MEKLEIGHSSKEMDYFGIFDIVSAKIVQEPNASSGLELVTNQLIVSEGISFGRLNVSEDVRSQVTWKGYGKLSLRDAKTSANDLENLAYVALSALGLSVVETAIKSYKDWEQIVRQNWNLAFSGNTEYYALKGLNVGGASFSARKFSGTRSRQVQIYLQDFLKTAGYQSIEAFETGEGVSSRSPILLVRSSYSIPQKSVSHVLDQEGNPTKKYAGREVVLRNTVRLTGLSPDNQEDEHRIRIFTTASGTNGTLYQKDTMKFPGPVYVDKTAERKI